MVCEGLLNYFGTSSAEIAEKAVAPYIPQIQKLTSENDKLTLENDKLISQITMLKQKLAENNIAY